jgi:signal transduction protein with GAF and PtsI domain
VAFRTLDIGSDKVLPYMKPNEEPNPAMGWRAIRVGLDKPGVLRMQLQALIRAAAGAALDRDVPNDLKQFFFAADRENERVRKRYDMLNTSFLSFLGIHHQPLRPSRAPICPSAAKMPAARSRRFVTRGARAFALFRCVRPRSDRSSI